MNSDYAMKIVFQSIKSPKQHQKTPEFRLKSTLIIKASASTSEPTTSKSFNKNSVAIMAILKQNIIAEEFIPFHKKYINKEAYDIALIYISSQQEKHMDYQATKHFRWIFLQIKKQNHTSCYIQTCHP
jgi:hypothetical protein